MKGQKTLTPFKPDTQALILICTAIGTASSDQQEIDQMHVPSNIMGSVLTLTTFSVVVDMAGYGEALVNQCIGEKAPPSKN